MTAGSARDFSRTRAALAVFDAVEDAWFEAGGEQPYEPVEAARLAIGEAFAADTADINSPEVARLISKDQYGMERVREFCAASNESPDA